MGHLNNLVFRFYTAATALHVTAHVKVRRYLHEQLQILQIAPALEQSWHFGTEIVILHPAGDFPGDSVLMWETPGTKMRS